MNTMRTLTVMTGTVLFMIGTIGIFVWVVGIFYGGQWITETFVVGWGAFGLSLLLALALDLLTKLVAVEAKLDRLLAKDEPPEG